MPDPTRIKFIDGKIQFGQGRAAQVLGQTYEVRRLDPNTNISVSANNPVFGQYPVYLRETKTKVAIEGVPFELHTYIAICNNQPLLNLVRFDLDYDVTAVQLREVGYEAFGPGWYTLARVRPTQETILVRSEFTGSITRPYPTAGTAASMPSTPGQWVEDLGFGGTPKSNELVMTLSNGLYSFQSAGAQMATVQVGLVQTKRIKEDNELRAESGMTLPGGEFCIFIPTLPGVILRRNDRINLADRYEIRSFFNSEAVGLSGNICLCSMMGV